MKYKVGDKVRVRSKEWYDRTKSRYGDIECGNFMFYPKMSHWCGEIITIAIAFDGFYKIKEDNSELKWTDEMIEGLVEEESKPKFKVGDKVILDPYPCIITDVHWRDSLHGFVYTVRGIDFGKTVKETDLVFDERPILTTDEIVKNIKADWNNFKNRYNLPNEYHFVDKNGNEVDISDIVLEKKKKEYPKTFRECCEMLDIDSGCLLASYDIGLWKDELFSSLQKLLICRDAYWKIAGEEMGLGKPWEPSKDKRVYSFYRHSNKIETDLFSGESEIFEFPTAEMRDAFYENFKGLIESCKELL